MEKEGKDIKQIKEMLEVIFHRINTIEKQFEELAKTNETVKHIQNRQPSYVESLSNLYDWMKSMNFQKDQPSLNQNYLDKFKSYNSEN